MYRNALFALLIGTTAAFQSMALEVANGAIEPVETDHLLRDSQLDSQHNLDSYRQLAASGRYQEALQLTCKRFQLACKGVHFAEHSTFSSHIAETSALTNLVSVTPRAFFVPDRLSENPSYEEKFQYADMRFLQLILRHELVHKNSQNQMRRFSAAKLVYLGFPSAQYHLELDAWKQTVQVAHSAGYNIGTMRERILSFWVESQYDYYRELIRNPNANFN